MIVTREPIKFLFTNNTKIGSKIISHVTREPGQRAIEVPSHFSILLWEWLVIESTMLWGLKPKLYAEFIEHNTVLASFTPHDDSKKAAQIAKELASRNHNARYDFAAALYMGWFELLNLYFGVRIPEKNRFDNSNEFFCNELFREFYGGDVSMKHPNSLMREMMNDERFIRLS